MLLVMARVTAAAVVASEASVRTFLQAARQSAKDRTSTAETAATTAATERDSLASRLALAKAKVEKLRAAAMSAEEAVKRAKIVVTATETAARDAAQAAARKKAALEAKVSELERDLGTTTTDLATAGHQFSQLTDQLQVVTEEATQLRNANAKLSQDLDGALHGSCPLLGLPPTSHWILIRWLWLQEHA
jgi:chromosome segregation ATPase